MALNREMKYVSIRKPTRFVSQITTHIIHLNDSDKFVAPPTFDAKRLAQARLQWEHYIDGLFTRIAKARNISSIDCIARQSCYSPNAHLIELCFKAKSRAQFLS